MKRKKTAFLVLPDMENHNKKADIDISVANESRVQPSRSLLSIISFISFLIRDEWVDLDCCGKVILGSDNIVICYDLT